MDKLVINQNNYYEKIEALFDLLDEYDLLIFSYKSKIVFFKLKIKTLRSKMNKTNSYKRLALGSMLLAKYGDEIQMLSKSILIYEHYQSGLMVKLQTFQDEMKVA